MTVTEIGSLVSIISALLFLVLGVAAFLARRAGKDAREVRDLREVNVALLRWKYKVDSLAATTGWDQHAKWPQTPRELTAAYLEERAVTDDNVELLGMFEKMQQMLKEGPK